MRALAIVAVPIYIFKFQWSLATLCRSIKLRVEVGVDRESYSVFCIDPPASGEDKNSNRSLVSERRHHGIALRKSLLRDRIQISA
jgi:hypothetical protein